MSNKLAEIRALLKAEAEKLENIKNGVFTGNSQPDAFLAFWNIPEGQALNLRFLPDLDENNPFFWKERDMINLEFKGVVGLHTDTVRVQVPCNEMWGPKDSCPVLKELREWYATKNPDLEAQAQKYWKKKTYLFQCLIAPDSVAVKDDNAPENPIRRVLVNKGIFTKVKSILMNTGIKEMPTHYEFGRDFSIIKTKNGGGFNSYDESQFSMSERPLNEEERNALTEFGLFNLQDYMPKQPTPAELNAIKEMFEASVNGEAYDPSRWAEFYRPAGVQKPAQGNTTTTAPATTAQNTTQTVVESAPVQETRTETVATTTTSAPKSENLSASALVARLKAKQ